MSCRFCSSSARACSNSGEEALRAVDRIRRYEVYNGRVASNVASTSLYDFSQNRLLKLGRGLYSFTCRKGSSALISRIVVEAQEFRRS